MNKIKIVLIAGLWCTGCAFTPTPALIDITYKKDEYNVPYPVINGVPYKLTDQERDEIAQTFVNLYCPIN